MLRIHFTPQDIGRIRVATSPDPLWETVLSLFRFRGHGPPLVFGQWRRYAAGACRRADLEMLLPLVPGGYFPDFLTPAEGAQGLDAGIEALLATPVWRLRHDMDQLRPRDRPVPAWMRLLRDGDRPTLERLAAAIRSHHEAVVAPFWPDAQAQVEADRAKRARALLDGGADGLLRSYLPMLRWVPPLLEVDVPYDRDLHLDGRGLLLVPSFLSWRTPDVLRDASLPPVLVYPINHGLALAPRSCRAHASLAALIGFTRASILAAIEDGRTTSELARRVGVSAASISQHTTVLRDARLIHTNRVGKAVLHTVTPLASALLAADAAFRRTP